MQSRDLRPACRKRRLGSRTVSAPSKAASGCRPAAPAAAPAVGAIFGIMSVSTPSSGASFFMFGCGQSVPHSTRSGKRSDDGARERHHVVIGRARDGEALRAGDLGDPGLVGVDRLEPVLEMLALDAFLHVRAGHVVEHQRGRQRFEERAHLVEVGVLEIDHDVPAELGDARGDALHHVARRRIDQPLDEVEAHAAHAGVVAAPSIRRR